MLGALVRKSKPSFLLLRDGVGFGGIKVLRAFVLWQHRRENRRQRQAAPEQAPTVPHVISFFGRRGIGRSWRSGSRSAEGLNVTYRH
jgi:hypothetical protein